MKRSDEVGASRTWTTKGMGNVATNSIRDSQRRKVYNAERIAFNGGIEERHATPDYRTVAEVQAYVDHVTASGPWKALGFSHLGLFESLPLTVKDGRGSRRGAADAFGNTIRMPRFSRLKWYIMHELAHIATSYIHDFTYDAADDEYGGGWPVHKDPETGRVRFTQKNVAAHGPEFAGIYLYLLRELVGAPAHDKLQAAFEETGVKVDPVEVVADITTIEPVTDTDTQSERCLECGMALSSNRSRFCSDRCRWTHHNRRRRENTEANRQKVCEACGSAFVAKRSDARTCSAACRQKARRRRTTA